MDEPEELLLALTESKLAVQGTDERSFQSGIQTKTYQLKEERRTARAKLHIKFIKKGCKVLRE